MLIDALFAHATLNLQFPVFNLETTTFMQINIKYILLILIILFKTENHKRRHIQYETRYEKPYKINWLK